MGWVKLDDEFYDHPKVVDAGPLAGFLFVAALAWCNKHLTDGRISVHLPSRILGHEHDPSEIAGRLVEVGLWEVIPGGWQVHDYHHFQPSAEEERAKRRRLSEAGKLGAQRRWAASDDSPPHSTGHSPPHGESMASGCDPDAPVPVPVPNLSSSSNSLPQGEPSPVDDDDDEFGPVIAKAFELVAERRLQRQRNVEHPSRWKRSVIRNLHTEQGDEARRYLSKWRLSSTDLAAVLEGEKNLLHYAKARS